MATKNAINTDYPIEVAAGGTGATTLSGVLSGNGTAAVTASAVTQYGTVIAGVSNAVASVAPHATSGVPYISQGASSNPVFGTAVVAGGGTGLTSTTAYAVVCGGTTSTAALQSIASVGTSGQVLTSNGASALPTFQAASGGGMTWNEVTGTTQAMAVDNGYILNNAGLVTATLPATAARGSVIRVAGKGAGGWRIAQNASQIIYFGLSTTTTGATGYIQSTAARDSVELVCVTADIHFQVISSMGNITIT